MNISRNNDKEIFFANIERLFKLIHNVLAKGQTTAAEKYVLYLFTAITNYYIKESKPKTDTEEFFGFFEENIGTSTNSAMTAADTSLLGSFHKIKNYRHGFQDDITKLVSSQVKASNFYIFSFVFNLLISATAELLKNTETQKGGEQLIGAFKYVGQYILFNKENIPPGERHAYLHQSYDWFLDLLPSVNDKNALFILEVEMRFVFRSYIENNELELFESFLNSLSSRFFPFSIVDDKVLGEYMSWQSGNYEYRTMIEKYRRRLENPRSLKQYSVVIKEFESELKKCGWEIDKQDYEKKVKIHLFNTFKLTYCRILVVDAICYALFKGKYEFFITYLNYHEPEDADASWVNENYSLLHFIDIVPFLEDYDRLMSERFMWADRHGMETYMNTFLGYYILNSEIKTVQDYLNSINDTDTINVVKYNLQKIPHRNILRKLPENLLPEKNTIDAYFSVLLSIAKNRSDELDRQEVQTAPIDSEAREEFFTNLFQSFRSQAVARSIYEHYESVAIENVEGQSVGINQRFPRRAFIKQSGHSFLSPHSQLSTILADDETTHIFRQIAQRANKQQLSANAFEDYLRASKDKFDLLISANTYDIKANFPGLDFEESWAAENPQKKLPGYIGKLNGQLSVFWLGEKLPFKIFILLNSKNLGQLINCNPPTLSGDYNKRDEHFAWSFIDFANDDDHRQKLVERGQNDELLKSEVLIRAFECIKLNLPEEFEASYIEITT